MYKSGKTKSEITKHIRQICDWLYCVYEITVEFGAKEENEFCYETQSISICTKSNYRAQLHTLLHEAGHAMLAKDQKLYKKNFPFSDASKFNSRERKMDILREEVWAWEKGLEIADSLNIPIDRKWYLKHARKALLTYIDWIQNPYKKYCRKY